MTSFAWNRGRRDEGRRDYELITEELQQILGLRLMAKKGLDAYE